CALNSSMTRRVTTAIGFEHYIRRYGNPYNYAMKTAATAWVFFVLTGIFISLVVPLGEGFDEPWHLGYIQYLAQNGKLPPGPHLHLSLELESFLLHHPIGWRLRNVFPDLRTQEEYWNQPDSARAMDDDAVRSLHFSGSYIEAGSKFSEQYE